MPARNTFNNQLAATTLAVVIAAEMLWGCASTSPFPGQSRYPRPLDAISVVQHGLSLAVWLEDQCERREADERNLTLLEALHDGLIVPTDMLFVIPAVTVVSTVWSLYDRFTLPTGEPLPNRPQLVMDYVTPHRAGPQTESTKSHGTHLLIAWSDCLSASRDD
ncbi:MAG: hypothetical protein ABL970_02175 [Nitrospira sp.]